ncbi:MAG: phosphoenolpyruvate--protein phosphotransferase [Candidatus Latescibacteria bacterium]|nr:phosphoenolpyruvate--protein phosphotransferase [Candidatus Latescibacterota bacterium]
MSLRENQKAGKSIILREAKLLKEKLLDLSLVEVFAGEREGSPEEQKKLKEITARLKHRIYTEAVYLLTHIIIESSEESRRIFEDIIKHRNDMVRLLKRNVSMQVAALDYMQNVRNILKKPTIIEADQYEVFAYRAILDETTHTYEKDLLDSDIDAEIEKARRFGTVFSVLFLDLDDLKHINDTCGHETGTRAIQILSSCASENLRKYDSIYRYGGDEFVVLLPRADASQAYNTALRILDLVHRTAAGKISQSLGVSIGIASFDNDCIKDRNALLTAADSALYQSKKGGKDRISIYGDEKGATERQVNILAKTEEKTNKRHVLQGIQLVPGWCIGKIIHYRDILSNQMEVREVKQNEIGAEMERILHAVNRVRTDLQQLKTVFENKIDAKHAAIFDVHRTLLDDTDLLARLEAELKSRMTNSEHVVQNVFRKLERQFRTSGSALLSERASDIRDIGGRLLRVLTGAEDSILSQISQDSVIFSRRLLPSDTIHFTSRKPLAIVTEEGGPYCHSALIARALGIPSVSGIACDPSRVPDGTLTIVDGHSGKVIITPTDEEIAEARLKIRNQSRRMGRVLRQSRIHTKLNCVSGKIHVLANVASSEGIRKAKELGCDGIGLYRTEADYMLASEMPGEETVYEVLSQALSHFNNGPIMLRLADIGGDKILPYLNIGVEHASYLGMRGVRFLLNFPDFLHKQLRVFYRLSSIYSIQILVPFVTNPRDMQEIRVAAEKARNSLRNDNIPCAETSGIGAMVEIPLAALNVDKILEYSDFISIGTNDLTQYLSAADRESIACSHYLEEAEGYVIEMIGDIISQCDTAGKYCSVCGELASDSRYIKLLLDKGLRNFSVLPPLIPYTKETIYKLLSSSHKPDDKNKG